MSYHAGLESFIAEYWNVIVWLIAAIFFAAFARGVVNMFLGLKRLYKRHKPL